jgi:hypothetical protein
MCGIRVGSVVDRIAPGGHLEASESAAEAPPHPSRVTPRLHAREFEWRLLGDTGGVALRMDRATENAGAPHREENVRAGRRGRLLAADRALLGSAAG